MAQAFFGGVHPNDMKAATNEKAIEQLSPPPAQVVIPMSMHFGAPCTPIVSVGDYVKVGQKIGEFKGLGAPIHASVSGKVVAIEPRPYSMGGNMTSVVIENDYQNTVSEEVKAPADPNALTTEEMIEIVKNAGIVGMGGATFPTHVKISGGIGQVTTVIINGAECEPYVTSDNRMMLDHGEDIRRGIELLKKYVKPDNFVFAIENNKPQAIAAMKELFADDPTMSIVELPSSYPQGAKQMILYNALGKVVYAGQRFATLGVIIINVSTLAKVAKFMDTGMPLVDRVVTVDGSAIKEPKNVIAPIGTACKEVIDFAGGFGCEPKKLVMGGPMMGVAQYDLDAPVAKGTSAILAFNEKDARPVTPTACIRCGGCIDHCPMNLMPVEIERAYEKNDAEALKALKVGLCIECGCCAFQCPAHRPLVQVNKLSKTLVRDYDNRMKTLKEAGK